jgi:hypothetical protein
MPQRLIDLDTIGEPEHGPDKAAIVSEYVQCDVQCKSSRAEDGNDTAHLHVRLLAHLPPSPQTLLRPRPLRRHQLQHHDAPGPSME